MRARGFTLIELMIVIAIIAIIAAIAIPNLIEARKASNESSAIGTLKAVFSAQVMYKDRDSDKNGLNDYCDSFGKLTSTRLVVVPQNPQVPSEALRSGYTFGLVPPKPPGTIMEAWGCIAIPVKQGKSGDRIFWIDETGVIRFSTIDIATVNPADPPDFTQWAPIGGGGATAAPLPPS